MRPSRRWWLAAAAVVLAAAWGVWRAAAVPAAGWAVVERGDLELGVDITGTLKAAESSFLAPPQVRGVWEFKVAFMAPEGQEVAAGTPVLRFDTSQLEQRLEQLSAERDEAAKELEKKATDLAKRRQDLRLELAEAEARHRRLSLQAAVPEDLVASAELEETSLDLTLAADEIAYLEEKIRLEEKRAAAETAALVKRRDRAAERVAELERNIARMTLVAPRSGTVVYVTERGQEKVKVGDNVWQTRQVLEIPDLREMVAEGEVEEADVGRLAVGQKVRFTLDAHPGIEYSGEIAGIGRTVATPRRRSFAKVVKVEVRLGATDTKRMRPGMRLRGTVVTETVPQALLVPAEAVVTTAQGPRVYRRRLFTVEEVRPRLGRRGEDFVEVLAGLAEGDEVLRSPGEELQ